jgi:hypothetical protein
MFLHGTQSVHNGASLLAKYLWDMGRRLQKLRDAAARDPVVQEYIVLSYSFCSLAP